jgi:thiamine-monophosphate kinase
MRERRVQKPTVQDLGEDRLLDRINNLIDPAPKGVVGVGDDAAVLGRQLLTTDTLVDNVHFRRAWCTPEDVGWKALAVNLSDIAAMGGRPAAALVSLVLPGQTSVETVLGFYRGMRRLARLWKVAILGGNLARGELLSLTLTVIGEPGRRGPILRSGARPGDRLYLSGEPGLARLGYLILERELPSTKDGWVEARQTLIARRKRVADAYPGGSKAIRAFLLPAPRLDLPRDLRPSAMMDLSDGLAADLPRLGRASGVGIVIDLAALPISRSFWVLCDALGVSPETTVLEGGEDYELIATLPASLKMPKPWHAIGEITSGNKIHLRAPDGRIRALTRRGFDHFKTP